MIWNTMEDTQEPAPYLLGTATDLGINHPPAALNTETREYKNFREYVDWTRGDILGKGAFGTCYHVTIKETGASMALKKLPRNEDTEKEISIMRGLSHVSIYIITLYYWTQYDDETVYLFLEYMKGGTLNDLLRTLDGRGLGELDTLMYTEQLLKAVEYLQDLFIAHNDIGDENILLRGNRLKLALCDFGIAQCFNLDDGDMEEDEIKWALVEDTKDVGSVALQMLLNKGDDAVKNKTIWEKDKSKYYHMQRLKQIIDQCMLYHTERPLAGELLKMIDKDNPQPDNTITDMTSHQDDEEEDNH